MSRHAEHEWRKHIVECQTQPTIVIPAPGRTRKRKAPRRGCRWLKLALTTAICVFSLSALGAI